MKFTFIGKNFTVSDALKEQAAQKIGRLSRLFPEDTEASVAFSAIKLENKVEVTIPLNKRTLRASVSTEDMYRSIDEIVDVIDKQMVKYKTRLKNRSRKDQSFKDEYLLNFSGPDEAHDERNDIVIEKNKRFEIRPMDVEEAVMEMELLGHDFFVFRNGRSDTVNVVYRRNNGSYGLIEPEY